MHRFVFGLIGILFISLGVGTLLRGALHYPNAWGGMVFAPFVILIGAGVLLAVIFAPKTFVEEPKARPVHRRMVRGEVERALVRPGPKKPSVKVRGL